MAYILVADDEKTVFDVVLASLDSLGHEIVHVENGREALSRCLARKPDLLITDNTMPEMSGQELIESLRAMNFTNSIKIIFLTAEAEDFEKSGHKADALIAKPFRPTVLLAKVVEVLGQ